MSRIGRWTRRLWYLLNRRQFERDLEREMASHRAMMGDPRSFGSSLRLREQNADVWGWTWIDDLWQDLRYAVRLLHRAPAFAAAAIATLALGIGASTAIFSVAYGVSLRPLPYADPDRLIRIYEANPRDGQMKEDVSEGAFHDWREGAPSLEAAALFTRLESIAIDRPVLLTALASSVIAMVVVGSASRRGAGMTPVARMLQGGGPAGDTRSRHTARHVLVFAQCAGAVALVVVAVMLTRSFALLSSLDLGWTPSGVVSLKPEPPMPRTRARSYWVAGWADRLIARLEATPGIERAAITTSIPLSPNFFPVLIARGGDGAAGTDRRWSGIVHHVTDGYFDLMGISLVAGRTFTASDRFSEALLTSGGGLPEGRAVTVVSQSVARSLWAGRPAVGQAVRVIVGSYAPPLEVVGVVEDLQFHAVGEQPTLHVFVPWTQQNTGNPYLLARVSGNTASSLTVVRQVVETVEAGTAVDQVTLMEALVARATARPRFTTRTVAAFALLALTLAAIGIYGTLSYVVGTQTREIAIRLSLGAAPGAIVPDVLKRGLTPVVTGGLLGILVAAALARTFEALLFQVEPFDLPSFAAGAVLLLVAALAAALGPAVRAMKIDPVVALRSE